MSPFVGKKQIIMEKTTKYRKVRVAKPFEKELRIVDFLNMLTTDLGEGTKNRLAKKATNLLRSRNLKGTICWSPVHACYYLDESVNLTYKGL